MATIVLRSIKGVPLTNAEVDANFSNLNADKLEISDAVSTNTVNKVVRRDSSGNFSAGVITASLDGEAATAVNVKGGTTGGVLYQIGANTTSSLAIGSAGQVLTSNGVSPYWTNIPTPDQITITNDTVSNQTRYIIFAENSAGNLTQVSASNTKLYYNPSTGSVNAIEFNSLSDASQKTDIVAIKNATKTIEQINGVEFDWVDNSRHSAGVIAQQLETILPFLVETNEQGIKSVNYSGLIAYLIESNKELSKRIALLEKNA